MIHVHMANISTMHDYARIGAAARLTEIQAEIAAIRHAFPELDSPANAGRTTRASSNTDGRAPRAESQAAPAPKQTRKTRSAAARKAMSEAQKKRWATQKALSHATVS
jgi:hypothetical protein